MLYNIKLRSAKEPRVYNTNEPQNVVCSILVYILHNQTLAHKSI